MKTKQKIEVNAQGNDQPSPYTEARREWEERYGGFVDQARTWKIVGILAMAAAIVATSGATYLACTKEIKGYVIQTDSTGVIKEVKPMDSPADPKIMQKIIAKQLASFIKASRNVVIDAVVERDNVNEAYSFIQKETPALTKLNAHFMNADPFKRAKTETVYVDITAILPLKEGGYQLQWQEKTMDRQTGELVKATEKWTAVCYTEIRSPGNETSMLSNPTGLTVKDFNWSKEI